MQLKHTISLAAEFVAVVSGLVNYAKIDKKSIYLVYFVCFALLTEIGLNVLADVFDVKYNLPLLHIYAPIEFLLLSLVYYRHLVGHVNRYVLLAIIVGFGVFCILNPLLLQGWNEYSQARSFSSIILIGFSILYYHKVMVEARVESLSKEPMVWINTAVLFYFAGNLFYNALFKLILEYSREFSKLTTWYFGILNVMFYLLIAIGFYKAGRVQTNTV
jgi:hypothetical protein